MKLSARLKAIADLIPNNSNVIDVGCDHAYLSIYLTLEKNVKCIASDINTNVIKIAEKNIKKFNTQDSIELVLSNGLKKINIKNNDYIVISGMGTTTILSIIDEALINDSHTIIIQSNKHLTKLRSEMVARKFLITNEKVVYEKGKIYPIIIFKKGIKKYLNSDYIYGPYLKYDFKYYNNLKKNPYKKVN